MASESHPICVDLDGTILRTDLLLESAFWMLRRNSPKCLLMPAWLMRGKAYLKHRIAESVEMDPALLPYNDDVLAFLREERSKGRRLVLATASNSKLAGMVAGHLQLFDEVLSSQSDSNLAGPQKRDALIAKYGDGGFDYVGNDADDLPIWPHADQAILVNPTRAVRRQAELSSNVTRVMITPAPSRLGQWLKPLRLHQWVKNLLIFLPLLLAHRVTDVPLAINTALAFLSFCLCASSVYVLNDLLDLPSDRQHPTKRNRPFASGSVPIVQGLVQMPLLLLGAFAIAVVLPVAFVAVLALYYVSTLAYSLRIKRVVLLDVLTLAGLYTLRILAGSAAISIAPSFWLLAFSMFLFLSLAIVKRYTELYSVRERGSREAAGRGYRTIDLETLAQFGISSAYMSVLVLALYVDSQIVTTLYRRPVVLWLLCPLLLYVVSRIWLLARRNQLDEDPVIFAITDRRSQLAVVLGAAILWLAI